MCFKMSKERLEESKDIMNDIKRLISFHDFKQADVAKSYLVELYADWFIEQAERYDEVTQDAIKLHNQNKRYREALEFYSRKENYRKLIIEVDKMILGKMIIKKDNGDKAREALESESNGSGR